MAKISFKNRFLIDAWLLLFVLDRITHKPTSATKAASTAKQDMAGDKILLNILRISTATFCDYAVLTAIERLRANETLSSIFDVALVTKTSERILSKGVGPVLKVFIDSITQTNKTFAFIIGPDFTAENVATAQITPSYNLVSISSTIAAAVFSDKSSFPMLFRGGPKNLDFTQAALLVMETIEVTEVTTLAFNEPFLVDSIRMLEHQMTTHRMRLQYSGVFDTKNRQEVIDGIMNAKPKYIATALFGQTEPQLICDLVRAGLPAPQQTIFVIFGPYGVSNWWIPKATDPTWHCSLPEMMHLFNGSFVIEAFYDDTNDAAESDKVKIGGWNGWQLNERFHYYRKKLNLGPVVNGVHTMYDTVWSTFDAMFRTEQRMRSQTNLTLKTALAASYHSTAFKQYRTVFVEEMLKTRFYGLTGNFAYDINQDRIIDLIIYQFQPEFASNTSLNLKLKNIGSYSVATNNVTLNKDRLRFATPDNSPPHVWTNTLAEQTNQGMRTRNTIIVVVAAIVAAAVLIGVVLCCFRRQRRQMNDLSWIIPFSSVVVATHTSRNFLSNRSLFSAGSSLASFATGKTGSGIHRKNFDANVYYIELDRRARIENLQNQEDNKEVWTRRFPISRVPGLATDHSGSETKGVRLNTLFPHAHFLNTSFHPNINRFAGLCVETTKSSLADDGDAMLFYDYAAKSSLRSLLQNEAFALDLSLKYGFVHDVASAVQFVHTQPHYFDGSVGFLHCNNIVLDNKFTAKLTDYGFWITRPKTDFEAITEPKMSQMSEGELEMLLSRAPEILTNGFQLSNDRSKLLHADIYTLGTVIVEIMTRQLPFLAEFPHIERTQLELVLLQQLSCSRRSKLTPVISLLSESAADVDVSLRRLISQCTQCEPSARPLASEVMKAIRQLPKYSARSFVENLIDRLQSYATNLEAIVAERTTALLEEMQRSEQLLLQILPPSVANKLKTGQAVDPETYSEVSVYFSDIVGFTALSAESSPMQIVLLLNALYTLFDSVLESFDVYKVETIGDAYMVASGLPIRNEHNHLAEIASMAIKLLREIPLFRVPHASEHRILLRIGLHVGPCVAGVVGVKMPRYCLFGDTINTASRMESTGEALKIHMSEEYKMKLEQHFAGQFEFVDRGLVDVKGKGGMHTYWLEPKSA